MGGGPAGTPERMRQPTATVHERRQRAGNHRHNRRDQYAGQKDQGVHPGVAEEEPELWTEIELPDKSKQGERQPGAGQQPRADDDGALGHQQPHDVATSAA